MKTVDIWTQIGSVMLGIAIMACVTALKTWIGIQGSRNRSLNSRP